jgi:hypothetical protein
MEVEVQAWVFTELLRAETVFREQWAPVRLSGDFFWLHVFSLRKFFSYVFLCTFLCSGVFYGLFDERTHVFRCVPGVSAGCVFWFRMIMLRSNSGLQQIRGKSMKPDGAEVWLLIRVFL